MGERLQGKVAIITGSATGIGRAGSILFANEGAKVVVADRNDIAGEETADLIRNAGGDAVFAHTDVSKSEQVQNMVATALDKYGKVDILVNGAGILIRTQSRLADISDMEWDLSLNTNLRGVFYGCKYTIPHMLERGGSIVNISSVAGIGPTPMAASYGVSKAGVINLTLTAAREYAEDGIRANAIVPGLVDTPQARGSTGSTERFDQRASEVALGRAGQPEDIANLMLFLASDDSSFITGGAYVIDGGGTVSSWADLRREQ